MLEGLHADGYPASIEPIRRDSFQSLKLELIPLVTDSVLKYEVLEVPERARAVNGTEQLLAYVVIGNRLRKVIHDGPFMHVELVGQRKPIVTVPISPVS
jgi:hypothetical protein